MSNDLKLGITGAIEPNITFFGSASKEVLRLSKDGIWANPDIPADEAAKLVLAAIDRNIKVLVDKAVTDERNSWPAEMEAMERQVNILTDALAEQPAQRKPLTLQELEAAWNAQADHMNTWNELGLDEIVAWAQAAHGIKENT